MWVVASFRIWFWIENSPSVGSDELSNMMSGLWLVIEYGSAGGIGERTSDNIKAITSQSKFTVSYLSILHCISCPFFLYSHSFLTHQPNCLLEISPFANVKCPRVSLYFIIALNFSFHGSSNNDIVETDYSPLSCCRLLLDGVFITSWARCVSRIRALYEIPSGTRSHTAVQDHTRYEKRHSTTNRATMKWNNIIAQLTRLLCELWALQKRKAKWGTMEKSRSDNNGTIEAGLKFVCV